MAKCADQVRESSDTTSTGASIHLTGAVAPFRSFSTGFVTGDLVEYSIIDGTSGSEKCIGVFDSVAQTLTRITQASSNGNSPLNLSGGQQVFCDMGVTSMNQIEATRHALCGGI